MKELRWKRQRPKERGETGEWENVLLYVKGDGVELTVQDLLTNAAQRQFERVNTDERHEDGWIRDKLAESLRNADLVPGLYDDGTLSL